ncbi:LysR family transcriptional regulator [Aliiglaciecola sp. 2_MG-2023]|uniref:LysR family transcriptional regulator n=1 Tax=unclassified Aliiglaciecola TaxID=2593648 RepID=UPI0026E49671|nr:MULTISPECIES: LysR family transcriptional regulator [unclassified Aliiglaciecola]MDO6712943.1 LysR family transcriptional regulator [Aliiglaciecola sp. 2_MG-2023]MDO6753982.1 LysR family transcriptional regulator [Aliiglaciecola sp. 1_MG-2023]
MHHAISLESLRVLHAIERKGSFSEAAKALFKVPSALTYTMQKLESELGVELFDRSGKRATLTQAGLILLNEGQGILDAAERLEEKVKQVESGWETQLPIAKDTIMPNKPVIELIKGFCCLDKQVEITLIEEALAGGWDALYSNRCDLAIGVTGELPKGPYAVHQIGEIEFVFVVAKKHPLADFIGILEGQNIKQYPAIVVADSSRNLPERSSGLFESKQVIRVQNMMAKRDAQVQGLGIGFLPLHLIESQLDSGDLVAKATSLHRPAVPVYMAWEKHKSAKALAWFIEQGKNHQWF